jgi:hypothetical protein
VTRRARLTLHPSQDGAKQLRAQYGDRLICVRYRYDDQQKKRDKTVELIVEENRWEPPSCPPKGNTMVWVRIASYIRSYSTFQGKPALSDDRSFRLREAADHWRRELSNAFRAGKTIFVLLAPLQEVFIDTGRREYSGTGRNRQTTQIVTGFNNYQTLPIETTVTASEGRAIKLTREGILL